MKLFGVEMPPGWWFLRVGTKVLCRTPKYEDILDEERNVLSKDPSAHTIVGQVPQGLGAHTTFSSRIVQICVTTETEDYHSKLYALAEDGTMWWNMLKDGCSPCGWNLLNTGPLPQPEALPPQD